MRKKLNFEETKRLWYKKLKDSGFKDIEYNDVNENGPLMKSGPQSVKNTKNEILRDAVESYYRMCYHFLNWYDFENDTEKVIWEYHTEGLSVRKIVKIFKILPLKQPSKEKVWKTVKRLETIMKSKYLSI